MFRLGNAGHPLQTYTSLMIHQLLILFRMHLHRNDEILSYMRKWIMGDLHHLFVYCTMTQRNYGTSKLF